MGKEQNRYRPIRVGIVGIGRAGWKQHCEELEDRREKFEVVAGCDIEPERRKMIADRFGCVTYDNVREVIRDRNVELVDIVTRSPDHVRHAKLALKAGKKVFLEKPIALNYRQALGLRLSAAQQPGQLYIRHNRRFEPVFLHVREILSSGVLGNVYEVKLARHTFQRRDDWQTLLDTGGGQLLNWGPHIIDHGLQLLGAPVASIWSDLKKVAAVGDAEDHLKIVMVGRNDRVVDIEISGGVAIPSPQFVVYGSRGTLVSDGQTIVLKYLDPEVKLTRRRASKKTPPIYVDSGSHYKPDRLKWVEKTLEPDPKARAGMDSIWDYLFDSIRKRRKFPITLDQAVEVMKVISKVNEGTRFDRRRIKPR